MVYFQGVGKEAGRDPYFRHLYRDRAWTASTPQLLTPEDADHDISLSPSGKFFVDNYSKPDAPSTSVLRDADRQGRPAAREDGHQPPARDRLEAADADHGQGARRRRRSLRPDVPADELRSVEEVSDHQPHLSRARRPAASAAGSSRAARGDAQALAELGFVVVEIDGMGTPWRSKSFHEAYYGNMGDNTLPDQVAGMKELAARYPWIDIDRAGIYGHSGGGFATAAAMFRYPDFFKVGISQAGNHDNRVYEDDWAEKWQGLLEKNADGTTNYDNQANQLVAKKLKGKLLLAHGIDGQQRAVLQHAAGRRRADQGEQGFRSDHASRTAATASATSRTWCAGAGTTSCATCSASSRRRTS